MFVGTRRSPAFLPWSAASFKRCIVLYASKHGGNHAQLQKATNVVHGLFLLNLTLRNNFELPNYLADISNANSMRESHDAYRTSTMCFSGVRPQFRLLCGHLLLLGLPLLGSPSFAELNITYDISSRLGRQRKLSCSELATPCFLQPGTLHRSPGAQRLTRPFTIIGTTSTMDVYSPPGTYSRIQPGKLWGSSGEPTTLHPQTKWSLVCAFAGKIGLLARPVLESFQEPR